MILNFQVRLTEKVAFTLAVTSVLMLCLNLLATKLNVNRQRRNLFHVLEDLKSNHHHLLPLAVSLKNFVSFVARRAKRKIINGILINFVTDESKNTKKFPMWSEDHQLLAKIKDIWFSAKEVCYHNICRGEHENIAEATPPSKEELSLKKTRNVGEMKEQRS